MKLRNNVIGEIPGTDLANEVVMIGAHLDSHQSATGATDNRAGVAAMMEAMRILEVVGPSPGERFVSRCGEGRRRVN
jgi:carboxypeptidase Q